MAGRGAPPRRHEEEETVENVQKFIQALKDHPEFYNKFRVVRAPAVIAKEWDKAMKEAAHKNTKARLYASSSAPPQDPLTPATLTRMETEEGNREEDDIFSSTATGSGLPLSHEGMDVTPGTSVPAPQPPPGTPKTFAMFLFEDVLKGKTMPTEGFAMCYLERTNDFLFGCSTPFSDGGARAKGNFLDKNSVILCQTNLVPLYNALFNTIRSDFEEKKDKLSGNKIPVRRIEEIESDLELNLWCKDTSFPIDEAQVAGTVYQIKEHPFGEGFETIRCEAGSATQAIWESEKSHLCKPCCDLNKNLDFGTGTSKITKRCSEPAICRRITIPKNELVKFRDALTELELDLKKIVKNLLEANDKVRQRKNDLSLDERASIELKKKKKNVFRHKKGAGDLAQKPLKYLPMRPTTNLGRMTGSLKQTPTSKKTGAIGGDSAKAVVNRNLGIIDSLKDKTDASSLNTVKNCVIAIQTKTGLTGQIFQDVRKGTRGAIGEFLSERNRLVKVAGCLDVLREQPSFSSHLTWWEVNGLLHNPELLGLPDAVTRKIEIFQKMEELCYGKYCDISLTRRQPHERALEQVASWFTKKPSIEVLLACWTGQAKGARGGCHPGVDMFAALVNPYQAFTPGLKGALVCRDEIALTPRRVPQDALYRANLITPLGGTFTCKTGLEGEFLLPVDQVGQGGGGKTLDQMEEYLSLLSSFKSEGKYYYYAEGEKRELVTIKGVGMISPNASGHFAYLKVKDSTVIYGRNQWDILEHQNARDHMHGKKDFKELTSTAQEVVKILKTPVINCGEPLQKLDLKAVNKEQRTWMLEEGKKLLVSIQDNSGKRQNTIKERFQIGKIDMSQPFRRYGGPRFDPNTIKIEGTAKVLDQKVTLPKDGQMPSLKQFGVISSVDHEEAKKVILKRKTESFQEWQSKKIKN